MLETDTKIGLKVHQNGNSKQVTLPAEWVRDLEIEKGDWVDAEMERDERSVTFHF